MIGAGLLAVIAQEANRKKGPSVAEVFASTQYTSAGGARTITNGIDLSTYGGMLWERCLSHAGEYHSFVDSKRGLTQYILPESLQAEGSDAQYISSFNVDGYSLQTSASSGKVISSNVFRNTPGFMDIVLYSGTGSARTVVHNLGSEPGLILVKNRSASAAWRVYHRSLGNDRYMRVDGTEAMSAVTSTWGNTNPTDTTFSVSNHTETNAASNNYVAYVFAHNPAGLIQCGSYTGNGLAAGPSVNLGWKPQWLLIKRADSTSDWNVLDTTRGFGTGDDSIITLNNLTAGTLSEVAEPTSNGFSLKTSSAAFNASGGNYIYMAIRA